MERLKQLRKNKKITQIEFAKLLNLSQQVVSDYERGVRFPDLETLKRIANFYDCSIDFLLGNTKPNYNYDSIALKTVSVEGLDKEEVQQIINMIELLRKKHT